MNLDFALRGRGRTFVTSAGDEYALGLLALARSFAHYHPADQLMIVRRRHRTVRHWDDALRNAGATVVDLDFSCLDGLVQSWGRGARVRYGHETFLKFLLPLRLSRPFWWIDADVIVQHEIDDASLPNGAPCAFAPHPWPRSSCFNGLNCRDVATKVADHSQDIDGIQSDRTSLNGGLCWFDPCKFKQSGLPDAIRAAVDDLAQTLVRADESVVNLLSRRFGVGSLQRGLQTYVHSETASEDDFADAVGAATLHFTGPVKPWMQGYSLAGPVSLYREWIGDLWSRAPD